MAKSKFAHLSKEEKLELLEALERKQEIMKRTRGKFVPHAGQEKILKSEAKIKICTSANSFGKSALGVNLLHARCTGVEEWSGKTTKVPIRAVVLLDNPSKIAEVWRQEYNKWHNIDDLNELRHGSPYVKEWQFKNGSSVRFLTQDQDQLTFESIQFDLLIIDEPCNRAQFIGLTRGQRAKGVQAEIIMIGTPISHDHAWIRDDLITPCLEGKRPDTEVFTGTSYDNAANLDAEFLTRFESLLTEKEKRTRMYGEFASMESSVFGSYINDSIHSVDKATVPWDYSWPVVVGIDNATAKAHKAVMIGRRLGDDKLFVLSELSAKVTAREFAQLLYKMTAGYKVVDWVCDSAGIAEATGHEGYRSFIEVLNDCGIKARPTTFADKLYEDHVERIRGMLQMEDSGPPLFEMQPRLRFIDGAAPGAYRELKQLTWLYDKRQQENKPKLNSAKLDYFSALSYGLSSTWLAKTVQSRGIIQKQQTKSGMGQSYASGLGVVTSKSVLSKKQPMKRFYTKNRFKDEDDF